MIKDRIYNVQTKKETIIYYTEEELAEIKAKEEEEALENALIPTKEEIDEAEFELKLLNKLTEWGVIF